VSGFSLDSLAVNLAVEPTLYFIDQLANRPIKNHYFTNLAVDPTEYFIDQLANSPIANHYFN
jgi:hypothetical protein